MIFIVAIFSIKEQSKELKNRGGYFQRLGRAFLLAEVRRSSVYCSCLKNMPEGQKRIPKILRCIWMETKMDMLVVGEKNTSILQNLVKMMVKCFVTHFKGTAETFPPSSSVLCSAASLYNPFSRGLQVPFPGYMVEVSGCTDTQHLPSVPKPHQPALVW